MELMKKFLSALLVMIATTASLAAQQAAQQAAPPVEKTALASQVSDCGCEDKPLPEILGVVNGVKITKQDLSQETRTRVDQLQRQVIDARQRELDLQIDSMLLETEAKKRGVPSSQVIKDDVVAKVQAPTEAEAQAFYDKNKASFKTEFKDEKNNILEYLRYQRQQEQAQKLAERLRGTAQ